MPTSHLPPSHGNSSWWKSHCRAVGRASHPLCGSTGVMAIEGSRAHQLPQWWDSCHHACLEARQTPEGGTVTLYPHCQAFLLAPIPSLCYLELSRGSKAVSGPGSGWCCGYHIHQEAWEELKLLKGHIPPEMRLPSHESRSSLPYSCCPPAVHRLGGHPPKAEF